MRLRASSAMFIMPRTLRLPLVVVNPANCTGSGMFVRFRGLGQEYVPNRSDHGFCVFKTRMAGPALPHPPDPGGRRRREGGLATGGDPPRLGRSVRWGRPVMHGLGGLRVPAGFEVLCASLRHAEA